MQERCPAQRVWVDSARLCLPVPPTREGTTMQHESPVSRRNLLGAAAAGAAAIGTSTLLSSPAQAAGGHGGSPAACPATRSACSSTRCATSSASTSRPASPSSPRSDTPGSSTPASSAAPPRSSARPWTTPGLRATSGHVGIPQPWNADTWQRALEDAADRRQQVHRAPVLRPGPERPDPGRRGVPRVRRGPEQGRRSWPAGPGSASATTTTRRSSCARTAATGPASTS